ncbi:transporter substrate-binding domain-containing protein [Phaeobacter inhibens]|uniref:transporter substrate-binding domain-containing protein n=1 Tax=Phaeobacter inhibens TaxID=221822 RepID=UPI0035CD1B29
MNAVAEETGLEGGICHHVVFRSESARWNPDRIDTIANQITITPERSAKFAFTQAYVIDGAQVVVKRGK